MLGILIDIAHVKKFGKTLGSYQLLECRPLWLAGGGLRSGLAAHLTYTVACQLYLSKAEGQRSYEMTLPTHSTPQIKEVVWVYGSNGWVSQAWVTERNK